jgi:hypothetical protein
MKEMENTEYILSEMIAPLLSTPYLIVAPFVLQSTDIGQAPFLTTLLISTSRNLFIHSL